MGQPWAPALAIVPWESHRVGVWFVSPPGSGLAVPSSLLSWHWCLSSPARCNPSSASSLCRSTARHPALCAFLPRLLLGELDAKALSSSDCDPQRAVPPAAALGLPMLMMRFRICGSSECWGISAGLCLLQLSLEGPRALSLLTWHSAPLTSLPPSTAHAEARLPSHAMLLLLSSAPLAACAPAAPGCPHWLAKLRLCFLLRLL